MEISNKHELQGRLPNETKALLKNKKKNNRSSKMKRLECN
jgi:hypothetical protein